MAPATKTTTKPISSEIRGLKYEGLWASPSVLMVRWGDVGRPFVRRLDEVKHATVVAVVYRGDVHGSVRAKRNGEPSMRRAEEREPRGRGRAA